jgi:hypothetical protein
MAENQYGFPTEVLSLPSKGLLYPEDSPLRSGTIDVKYMTAKEEDILTSTNLIAQGKVIERLLESVIVTPNVKLDDLLVGDKNAVMMGTRILGYGSGYNVSLNDPETNEEVELQVDLTTLKPKEIDEKLLENGENKFEFELPNSKRKVEFRLLNGHDEKKIEEALKELEKVEQLTGISSELTTRIKHQLISVDGNTEQSFINNFVDNEFLALDTRAYRKYVTNITPDIDLSFDYRTKGTGKEVKVDVPLGVEFFWPAGE